ncbi:hypothetical protein LZ30DRAFT_355555 [Colletotrichum cereale]|nr:hypothetical protein LZ30DRAFT_355555 [Colletotrichum cereale]
MASFWLCALSFPDEPQPGRKPWPAANRMHAFPTSDRRMAGKRASSSGLPSPIIASIYPYLVNLRARRGPSSTAIATISTNSYLGVPFLAKSLTGLRSSRPVADMAQLSGLFHHTKGSSRLGGRFSSAILIRGMKAMWDNGLTKSGNPPKRKR